MTISDGHVLSVYEVYHKDPLSRKRAWDEEDSCLCVLDENVCLVWPTIKHAALVRECREFRTFYGPGRKRRYYLIPVYLLPRILRSIGLATEAESLPLISSTLPEWFCPMPEPERRRPRYVQRDDNDPSQFPIVTGNAYL